MPDDTSRGRPLKVGVQLPEVERIAPWSDLARMATTIEALGYDSIWVGDHLIFQDGDQPPRGPWEAWTVMAAVAAITNRVEIGPLVACTSFHNPGMIAKKAATLDEVSGGRLILGLGRGAGRVEFDGFRQRMDDSRQRFVESAEMLLRGLETGYCEYDGDFVKQPRAAIRPAPFKTFRGRTYVATVSPESIAIIAWDSLSTPSISTSDPDSCSIETMRGISPRATGSR